MISKILIALEQGIDVIKNNTKLFFVGVLVFVFPLLFIWVNQLFFTVAHSNIETAQKNTIATIHDSLSTVLESSVTASEILPELISTLSNETSDITKLAVYKQTKDGFAVIFADDRSSIGSIEQETQLFTSLPLAGSKESFIFKTHINDVRTWQAVRKVETQNTTWYVFSEHSYERIDTIMAARKQQSYLGLTGIFLFLIALAYWINRQTSWQNQSYKLKKRLAERDLFANMIAHELRSPLTAIKGYAGFLEETTSIEKKDRRFASQIKASSERLIRLVSDFLEVSRIQSNKLNLSPEKVIIHKLILDSITELAPQAKEKSLILTLQDTPAEPVLITIDPQRFTQIISNIISNAIKYTQSGSITVSYAVKRRDVVIRVQDTGVGISAEDQQKIFAPFMRVGQADDSLVTGSGLGMWITKELVTQMQGTIAVESISGVGTHVVIRFPTQPK